MNIFDTMQISASALEAQRMRLNVISSNMANVETTRTPEGGPYRRREAVLQSQKFDFSKQLDQKLSSSIKGVSVPGVQISTAAPVMVYDPGHPDANQDGFVAKPNIDMVREMADMMSATRAYEANVTVVKSAKRMALKALEIGR